VSYIIDSDDRDLAADEALALQSRGIATAIYGRKGRWAVLDLGSPIDDVADTLTKLGLGPDRAADEAARLVKRGY